MFISSFFKTCASCLLTLWWGRFEVHHRWLIYALVVLVLVLQWSLSPRVLQHIAPRCPNMNVNKGFCFLMPRLFAVPSFYSGASRLYRCREGLRSRSVIAEIRAVGTSFLLPALPVLVSSQLPAVKILLLPEFGYFLGNAVRLKLACNMSHNNTFTTRLGRH